MKTSISKSKVFAPVLAGLLLASVLVAQEGPPPAAVQVGFALEQEMSPLVWVPGTVVSRNQAAIATEIAGQLTWVAEVGDVVKKGDVIARINDQSLQLQLKNDEATIKRHEANLQYLEQQVKRLERLTEQQVAPASDLEEAVSQRETLVQEIVQAKVAVEQTSYQLSRTRVTAPFSGRVVERLQQPGGYASVGGPGRPPGRYREHRGEGSSAAQRRELSPGGNASGGQGARPGGEGHPACGDPCGRSAIANVRSARCSRG